MPLTDAYRTLESEDFTFHGFEGLMDSVAESLQEVEIRSGEPEVSVVEDAIFVPSQKLPATDRSPGRFVRQGSLLTSAGERVELAQSRRRRTRWGTRVLGEMSEPAAVEPARRIDEDVVYLGWYIDHFGHFLMESLARSWFLDQVDPSVKVVFHMMRTSLGEGTHQILEAFGVPLERVLFLDEPTRLRRVFVPEPLYELSTSAHEWMPRPFRKVAAELVTGEQRLDQPLYLSRRLLPSHLRQIVGEFELEEVLRENGFRVAYPETMSFADQVRLFNQHAHVLTSAGSAAYNVLFALRPPTLHFLTSGMPRLDYFLAPTVVGAAAAYCNCLGRGGRPSINTTPLLAEIPTLVDYLDSRGFLRKRLRASLAGADRGVQERFDEAWLYASVRDVPDGELLAPGIEEEALQAACLSWPISWMLARYYCLRDPSRVDGLCRRFCDLATKESDFNRLAQHQFDIESKAKRIVKFCEPETLDLLTSVLRDRFLVDVPNLRRRKDEKGEPAALNGVAGGSRLAGN